MSAREDRLEVALINAVDLLRRRATWSATCSCCDCVAVRAAVSQALEALREDRDFPRNVPRKGLPAF